ncbi:uncharacterized protein TEOVI_000593100 [Trypanosoma equiperdum]|uniref:Uncharacterized protein n=1 Tax=Trypanosoma equiperdum TaxID=5694 RepID=A0A1G4I9T4_TRYEQ|nr:hypothetical protein TEOVI_000593100 [Trypanosoma equiperdum]
MAVLPLPAAMHKSVDACACMKMLVIWSMYPATYVSAPAAGVAFGARSFAPTLRSAAFWVARNAIAAAELRDLLGSRLLMLYRYVRRSSYEAALVSICSVGWPTLAGVALSAFDSLHIAVKA